MRHDMTLQERIDAVFSLRNERLTEQKRLDKMKDAEDVELNAILSELVENDIDQLQGLTARVVVKEIIEPEVTNWSVFQTFIRETGQIDLLQKRPMVSAIKARWETGDDVPGVERMVGTKITLGPAKV
jgi:hypothetical protein